MRSEELLALRGEVKTQCFRGMNAGEELERHLTVKRIRYDSTDPLGKGRAIIAYLVDTWSRVHGILSAGGVVARILWPKPPSDKKPRSDYERILRERARAACDRANEIWRTWPMPGREALAPLEDRHARNAMEHAENGAPEWIESFDRGSVHAYGIGKETTKEGIANGRPFFRYLFMDTLDVRIGKDTTNLRRIVNALNTLQLSLPFEVEMTAAGVELVPTDPARMVPGLGSEPRDL